MSNKWKDKKQYSTKISGLQVPKNKQHRREREFISGKEIVNIKHAMK